MEKLYTVEGVAELTGLTGRTIRNYIADGRLRGRKIGAQWRFTEQDIDALFEDVTTRSSAPAAAEPAAPSGTPRQLAEFLIPSERDYACACAVVDVPADTEPLGAEISRRVDDFVAGCAADRPEVAYSYDDDNAVARFIISGSLDLTAKLIKVIRKG